ncbi:MAG TPA: hypothetical protein VIW71_03560, partial [Streptomyces sp.]
MGGLPPQQRSQGAVDQSGQPVAGGGGEAARAAAVAAKPRQAGGTGAVYLGPVPAADALPSAATGDGSAAAGG